MIYHQPPTTNHQLHQRMLVHLALFTVALLFSLNYLISKLGMREFAPLSFAWLRVAGSAVLLSLLVRHDPEPPLSSDDRKLVTGFSILAVVLNQTLFLTGLSFTTVSVAAVLITSVPVFTIAIAILLGRERASMIRIGGIALACAGALLVVGREGMHGSRHSILGALMIFGNCTAFALYLVLSKPHMRRLSARRVVAWMFTIGTVLLLPIAALPLWRQHWNAISPRAWLALVLVILGPTVAAYLLNAWALRYADASLVAAYTYIQPVLASLLGAAFLGEPVHGVIIVAALMIFGGVWLAGRKMPT